MEYHIKHYELEQGALEIQYIEEYFGEFPRKKTAQEIMNRLRDREYLILMAEAPLPDDDCSRSSRRRHHQGTGEDARTLRRQRFRPRLPDRTAPGAARRAHGAGLLRQFSTLG